MTPKQNFACHVPTPIRRRVATFHGHAPTPHASPHAGRARDPKMVENLRNRGIIRRPEDLQIDPLKANRQLLAAHSIKDLVNWSGGLYQPPGRFRNCDKARNGRKAYA